MGYYPIDGYNTFLTNCTPNQFSGTYLNPYSVGSTMSITINFPLLSDISEEEDWEDTPDYELSDFYSVIGYPFKEFLDDENSFLYSAFELYRTLAINDIQYGNVKDENNWKRLLSLYIAHYLEIHLEDLKDISNKRTLSKETNELEYSVEKLSLITKNEFYRTSYGIQFWNRYSVIGSWVFKGHRTQRGRY